MFSSLMKSISGRVGDDSEMPVGDLPGWKQVGVQDFARSALLGQVGEIYGPEMRGYSGFPDSSGRGTYTPDSVLSVANGKLDYFLHKADGVARVASVIPFGYAGQQFGRYSVRFRYDSTPGYKVAFMLWPISDRWNEGEIDWPEGDLDGRLYGGSAIKGSFDNGMKFDPADRTFSPAGPGDWHVATTEWTPGKVRWFLDGQLIDQTTIPGGVPETSDRATSTYPDAATTGHLQIDWAVQYAYAQ
jgi:hypothetical protein